MGIGCYDKCPTLLRQNFIVPGRRYRNHKLVFMLWQTEIIVSSDFAISAFDMGTLPHK